MGGAVTNWQNLGGPLEEHPMKLLAACALLALALLPGTGRAADSGFDRAEVEREVMAVLDEFIRTFSAKDAAGHVATYHFPHYRLARGEMHVWPDAAAAKRANDNAFATLPQTGWQRSVWVHRQSTLR